TELLTGDERGGLELSAAVRVQRSQVVAGQLCDDRRMIVLEDASGIEGVAALEIDDTVHGALVTPHVADAQLERALSRQGEVVRGYVVGIDACETSAQRRGDSSDAAAVLDTCLARQREAVAFEGPDRDLRLDASRRPEIPECRGEAVGQEPIVGEHREMRG